MEKFSWVPFYTELAKKLLNYKNNRRKLADFVYTLDKTDYLKMQDKSKITDIDPFSFFGIFNRGTTDDNRKENLKKVKVFFSLGSEIPSDFSGIPVLDNRNSFYFSWYDKKSLKESCDEFWNLFENAVSGKISQEEFKEFTPIYFDMHSARGLINVRKMNAPIKRTSG